MADDPTALRLQERIRNSFGGYPPRLMGMDFIRYVHDFRPSLVDENGNEVDMAFVWAIYVSHDPSHDEGRRKADRHTVIAIHRSEGIFKVLARDFTREMAERLARGEDLNAAPVKLTPAQRKRLEWAARDKLGIIRNTHGKGWGEASFEKVMKTLQEKGLVTPLEKGKGYQITETGRAVAATKKGTP